MYLSPIKYLCVYSVIFFFMCFVAVDSTFLLASFLPVDYCYLIQRNIMMMMNKMISVVASLDMSAPSETINHGMLSRFLVIPRSRSRPTTAGDFTF